MKLIPSVNRGLVLFPGLAKARSDNKYDSYGFGFLYLSTNQITWVDWTKFSLLMAILFDGQIRLETFIMKQLIQKCWKQQIRVDF